MNQRLETLAGIFGATLVVAVSGIAAGRMAFARHVSREVDLLLAQARPPSPDIIAEDDLAGLPEPVARWLRFSGIVGKPRPAIVRPRQEGRFRQAPGARWLPFRAEQTYTTDPPGFVWAATVAAAPFVAIDVLDRYVAGHGRSGASLLSLVPLGAAAGAKIDAASLQRYLNGTMWFPHAALSPAVAWKGIDATSARATIRDGDLDVTADFVFADDGRLVTMTAARYRTAGKELILTPWATPMRDYGELNGVRVPVAGVGVWRLKNGDFSYIELRVSEIAYDAMLS